MSIATPEWLARHAGELREDKTVRCWLIFLNSEPQYRLDPHPVSGKFGCEIVQLNNGRHMGSAPISATEEEATKSGLEVLRNALGW